MSKKCPQMSKNRPQMSTGKIQKIRKIDSQNQKIDKNP
jgi:hypothetical protein